MDQNQSPAAQIQFDTTLTRTEKLFAHMNLLSRPLPAHLRCKSCGENLFPSEVPQGLCEKCIPPTPPTRCIECGQEVSGSSFCAHCSPWHPQKCQSCGVGWLPGQTQECSNCGI